MSRKPRAVRGLRQRLTRGRRLALERLETRESPGSILASAFGGNLFDPFGGRPFAESPVRLVPPNRPDGASLEPGRSSPR